MPPRARRIAHQLWVLLLALSLVSAGGIYLASLVIQVPLRHRVAGYAAFPILLLGGLGVRWAMRRYFPIIRRLHGVAGAKATILLGRITVSGNRLIVGAAQLPLAGITLEHVPNGTFAVLGEVHNPQRNAVITAFHIAFVPRAQSNDWQKLNLELSGNIIGVFDPAGREFVRRRDRNRARRAFQQHIDRAIDPRRPFFLTHRDAENRPWAVTFEAARGPGAYRVHVRRMRGEVVRIDCRLDDSQQAWRPAGQTEPADRAKTAPQR